MTRLADLILSHKRLVVAFWAVVTVAAFAAVGPAGGSLSQQFNIPGREGYETNKDIAQIYGSGGDVAPLVPVVTLPKGTTVDSPGVTAELASALARVKKAMPDVRIASYASTHDRAFVSDDGRTTFALVYHPAVGGVDPGQAEARKAQAALAGVTVAGSPVEITGMNALRAAPAESDSGGTGMLVETLLGALGALLVLIFVFRSFMAIVPLLMAAVAIPTTFLLIWPIANVTDVSVIVQFLVALIGLGIAIDYALLVVVRWREERRGGEVANETAVRNAMRHAGSAVVFSGTTVAISLLSLLALPMPALRSIGIAGLLIALVSVAVANTLLPVVLATVGPWLDRPRSNRDQSASRAWSAWARIVVRHRWIAASASTAVLAALVLAASQIQLGDPQADSLAQKGPARVGLEQLKDSGIGTGPLSPFEALVRSGNPASVAASIAKVEGVQTTVAPADWRRDGTAIVTIIPTQDANSAAGRDTLDRIRSADIAGVTVGGEAAQSADFLDAVYGNFPLMILAISVLTFILLARAFRSLDPAAQGRPPQPPLGRSRVGIDGARLAGRLRLERDLEHPRDTGDQRRDADRDLRLPVRDLDGLPGLHHQPHARGLRPHRLHRDRRRRRNRTHRPARHERSTDHVPRLRRLQRDPRHRGEDVRNRPRRRHPDRRHHHPRRPRPGSRRPARPLELVAPRRGPHDCSASRLPRTHASHKASPQHSSPSSTVPGRGPHLPRHSHPTSLTQLSKPPPPRREQT